MAKIRLIFVEKLANSGLLAAFSALISQIFSHFFFASYSCQALCFNNDFGAQKC
jgi:hypothetical protein